MVETARLLLAYGVLASFALFVSSNMREILYGSGYGYLLLMGVMFVGLIVLQGRWVQYLFPRRETWLLLAFIAYMGVKYFFESESTYETKQVLIGTSGGVVFAFGIGYICATAMTAIHDARREPLVAKLAGLLGLIYIGLVMLLAWGAFQQHMANSRSDLFLIEEQFGYYQRAGAFVLMQTILLVGVSTLLMATDPRRRILPYIPHVFLIVATTAVFGLFSQLVGSNSGLVASAAFCFIYVVLSVAILFPGRPIYEWRLGLSDLLFSRLTLRLLFGVLVAAALVALAAQLAIAYFNIDVSTMRVTGFGSGESSSVASRREIFQQSFMLHFFYEPLTPLFGNTQVHKLTDSIYVHSLLSLLTHLGFVGFFVFSLMLFGVYRSIAAPEPDRELTIFANRGYALMRLAALSAIVAMNLATAFFTWMPLWFCLALCGDWFWRQGQLVSTPAAARYAGSHAFSR